MFFSAVKYCTCITYKLVLLVYTMLLIFTEDKCKHFTVPGDLDIVIYFSFNCLLDTGRA